MSTCNNLNTKKAKSQSFSTMATGLSSGGGTHADSRESIVDSYIDIYRVGYKHQTTSKDLQISLEKAAIASLEDPESYRRIGCFHEGSATMFKLMAAMAGALHSKATSVNAVSTS